MYDAGCPHVDQARAVLTRALLDVGVPAVWTEWCTEDRACPEAYRGFGSPTVLVNGKDVAPGPHPWAPRPAGGAPRCRLYGEGPRGSGAPPAALVMAAVTRALEPDVV